MKTTLALAVAIALTMANPQARAEKLPNGLEFRAPAGWTVKANDQAAALLPPDPVTELGSNEPSELYLVGVQEGVRNLRDPQSVAAALKEYFPADSGLTLTAAPQPFKAAGGNGFVYRYDAVSQGIPLRLHIYLVELRGGAAAGLIAIARPPLMARRESALSAVAASLTQSIAQSAAPPAAAPNSTPTAPPAAAAGRTTNGPLAAQWDQRLRGHTLHQFSSYSSGYGSGGYNSQKTLSLGTDGNFVFRSSGSVSVYVDGANGSSASQNGHQGRWRIYQQGSKVLLELVSSQGETETIELTTDGSKTFLNGNRWLVGD